MNLILEEVAARLFVVILSNDAEWLWKFYYLFNEMVKEGKSNRFVRRMDELLSVAIRSTDKFLEVKVKKDIDSAIESYTGLDDTVMVSEPVFSQEPSDGSDAQNVLGGEMRSTYSFYDKSDEL